MDYGYPYFNNNNTNFEPKKLACEADFIEDGGSAVPLPEELTKLFKPLECELCGVIVTSEVTAYTHYEGKVHMKNVNAFMKEQYNIYGSMKKIKVEFTPHQCEVCKCELSSLIQAQQHYSGKIHKKNLRKINYDPQTAMPIPSDINSDDLGPDLLKDLPPPPPPPVLSDFICEICNITTNTEYQLIVHKNGSKHKKKVKKLKESFGDFGTDGFGYFTGDTPIENYVEGQECNSIEPIVTDYLPLSDEPLQFNNTNYINNTQYNGSLTESIPNQLNTEETDDIAPLCIKWFNDKKKALPPRPLEDAWTETFRKAAEETSSNVSNIRTHKAPPEVANLPEFSVGTMLKQLEAPPSPPIGLITSALFDISDTTVSEETPLCLDPPRIHFRDPKIKPDKESNEPSMNQPNLNENKCEKEISNLNVDSASSSNVDKTSASPKSISFEVTSVKNNLSVKSSNKEKPHKSVNSSEEKKNNEGNKGKFITSNWECSQEKNIDEENNLKKKNALSVLFGFKKGLGKKTTEDINKKLDNNLQETSTPKENEQTDIKDSIDLSKEVRNEKTEKSYEKNNLNKEFRGHDKQSCVLKLDEIRKKYSDNKDEESKYSKVKSYSKYRKDKYEEDSDDDHKDSHDFRRDSRDYRKDSHDYKESDDYRKDSHDYRRDSRDYRKDSRDYRKNSQNYKESDDYRKDSHDYRKDSRDYRKDSNDHHRSKASHKRHRDHRKRKDDYDSSTDSSDEDYRHEKKKHRHSSKREKESHKNKKPSLAQPFIHKTSTKHSIIDYLAPANECESNDIAMYRTPSGSYYCTKCDYKSKASLEFTNHLFSRNHKENKKNKTK
ncbi:peptidyl-prolyl cis-trans isomerase G [Halyomorpha halys]|uniref:peptidyl-prolyl cis-trans isomerase G n=1 Tax=Halyomorpha halys TaxID=286706 RepID=UPI0006D523A3|nr:uncharacterized protein LOC106684686 [Halyomorpha halys]